MAACPGDRRKAIRIVRDGDGLCGPSGWRRDPGDPRGRPRTPAGVQLAPAGPLQTRQYSTLRAANFRLPVATTRRLTQPPAPPSLPLFRIFRSSPLSGVSVRLRKATFGFSSSASSTVSHITSHSIVAPNTPVIWMNFVTMSKLRGVSEAFISFRFLGFCVNNFFRLLLKNFNLQKASRYLPYPIWICGITLFE